MVRELFVMAREHAPSIIFMDEIDSIGFARIESGSGNEDSEVQRTMLELLNQLDGFEASNKIKVLMATNRIDIQDQSLLRRGRIDRKIEFPNPNEEVYQFSFLDNSFFMFSLACIPLYSSIDEFDSEIELPNIYKMRCAAFVQ
ncbi:26S proteasome regulatory subunit 8 homolog B-like isoform X1 [Primulina eburnea]|uniref:26S proteasome regulatory subunit 8 homolog B-like isoform X1 n=1 Tax=Primulina eburnea TaxID=1245227 RepID=UPI003C6BDEED